MKMRRKFQAIVAISVAMGYSAGAQVMTTSLVATADTRIGGSLTQTNINNGGADQMLVGNHTSLGKLHGLLRFDLSSLGTNIVINSVTLQMNKPAVGTGSSFTVNVFELSVANTNWVEGTANNVAQSGSATWDSKGPSAWAGSAGASTAGTDYINTVLASYSGTTAAGDAAFISEAAFLTAVSNNAGGSLNLGIAINNSASGSYYRFATDEHATAAAPVLVIEYSDPPKRLGLFILY